MREKKRPGQKINMISVDELLGVNNEESAIDIKIDEIIPFQNHPFKVLDDDKMEELVKSIRFNGILNPVIIRPIGDNEYEMISGHRRMHAAKLLGLDVVPAFIRELSDEDATIVMVDTNLQREELLPSEKAFAYKMKYDAMKRRAGRPSKDGNVLTGRNLPMSQKNNSHNERNLETAEILGQQVGESRAQMHRYLRLTELIPKMLELVDNKRLPIMTAVDISYIPVEVQKYLYEYISENGMVKSYQVTALRKYLDDEGEITQAAMIKLLNDNVPGKTQTARVTITEKKLRKYFSPVYSNADMEKIIFRLLEQWKAEQDGGADGI